MSSISQTGLHCLRAFGLGFFLLLPVLVSGQGGSRGRTVAALPAIESVGGFFVEMDNSEGEEALLLAKQALAAATDEPATLHAMATLANVYRRHGDYWDGLALARDGLERARQVPDGRLEIEFLYLIGRIHWNLSDYPRSIETHLEELKLVQARGDEALIVRTHVALGLTYQRFGDKPDARSHFEVAYRLAQTAGDQVQLANILNSLGNYYLEERDYGKAADLHRQALKIRETLGPRRAIADSLTNLGLVADATGDSRVALDFLQRALVIYEPLKVKRYIANTHRRIASVLRALNRTGEGLAHLEQALMIAENLGSAEVLAAIYQEYALTSEKHNDLKQALYFERKLAVENEAMRSAQDRQRMDQLRVQYNAEQRELEITLLRRDQELKAAELQRRQLLSVVVGVGLVLGLALLGAIIVGQRQRLRAEKNLHAATEHARDRAQAAEQLKSRLLMMASHDLKVPLSALNATADLIGRSTNEPGTVRRLAEIMRADTARMRTLVRDFLEVSAIEDGNLQLHTVETDLPALARAAVETLQPVATAKEQALVLLPPAIALPLIEADPDRLRQVFDNLIGNAIKFTPTGGHIEVIFGEADGWVFAEVRDNGPGLGPNDFAKIFAPRPRLEAKHDGKEDSSGLGLVITRELLTLQGGRLEVQSQPGSGAVFRVWLPVANLPTVV